MKRNVKRLLAGVLALILMTTGAGGSSVFAQEIADENDVFVQEISQQKAENTEDSGQELQVDETLQNDAEEAEEVEEAEQEVCAESDGEKDNVGEEAYPEDEDIQTGETGTFTVCYVSDESGVSDLPFDDNTYAYGDLVTVSDIEPRLDGFVFAGWSPIGDPDEIYTAGYQFSITDNVMLTAIWETGPEETFEYASPEDPIYHASPGNSFNGDVVTAIDNYVNSLTDAMYPRSYYVNGAWKSTTCCALIDYVWEAVYGHSRRQKPDMCTVIDSKNARGANVKLNGAGIYRFLKANNAGSGDAIWCHDPYQNKNNGKYNITHYMIILDYDENGITLTDGRGVNGGNRIWGNHITVRWDDTPRNKYFGGNCYVRLYRVKESETVVGSTAPVNPGPEPAQTPTTEPSSDSIPLSGKCGDNVTWTLSENASKPDHYDLTISGTGPMYDYPEPDNDDDSTQTPWAVSLKKMQETEPWKHALQRITIQSGVTRIGNHTFYNNGGEVYSASQAGYYGRMITIPDTVEEIGCFAFAGSGFRGALTIPDSVTKLDEYAFSDMPGITRVTFGNKITEIPEGCFCFCTELRGRIVIPDGVTKIGKNAFGYCEKISEVQLPDSITEIGAFAFRNDKQMRIAEPILPPYLTELGQNAFERCSALTGTLTIPDTLKEIPFWCFRGCDGLTKTEFPLSTESSQGMTLNYAAFEDCSGLTGDNQEAEAE